MPDNSTSNPSVEPGAGEPGAGEPRLRVVEQLSPTQFLVDVRLRTTDQPVRMYAEVKVQVDRNTRSAQEVRALVAPPLATSYPAVYRQLEDLGVHARLHDAEQYWHYQHAGELWLIDVRYARDLDLPGQHMTPDLDWRVEDLYGREAGEYIRRSSLPQQLHHELLGLFEPLVGAVAAEPAFGLAFPHARLAGFAKAYEDLVCYHERELMALDRLLPDRRWLAKHTRGSRAALTEPQSQPETPGVARAETGT
jgi:hypothetical protein